MIKTGIITNKTPCICGKSVKTAGNRTLVTCGDPDCDRKVREMGVKVAASQGRRVRSVKA